MSGGQMAKKPITFDTPFDTYTSSSLIGEGGAGKVYAVSNSRGEEFALKCLAPDRITSERLQRFKNEIWFCQNHNHSNVVKVVDTGAIIIDEVKCPFYVMERYSGTLRSQMGNLAPDEIMPFFSQILNGIEAAHLSGVWHRDIKPENILFDHRKKNLLVADFGIAHFEEEAIFTAVETRVAARMANFQYSAPEQRVRNAKVDHRADIFALGLILNELFTGEILQGTGYKKIADVSGNHAYLDELVELMTQQNPENRPDSIEKIKKELIGRGNAFIALQRYNEAKKEVVSTAEQPEFEPIKIINVDYESGVLKLIFNRNAPYRWVQEFENPGSHSYIQGYGPGKFIISGDTAKIDLRRSDRDIIQDIINYAKSYVDSANAGYIKQLRNDAREQEQQQRSALEKKIADAENRKDILSKIKL
jgi:serine/threonine protein kinase